MNRFLLLAIGGLFGAALLPEAAAAPAAKPNVLMIIADDRNDWVGCLQGHPDVKTPNLDRLAGRGLLFTNAHCAAPVCNPSRIATMTGRRPSSTVRPPAGAERALRPASRLRPAQRPEPGEGASRPHQRKVEPKPRDRQVSVGGSGPRPDLLGARACAPGDFRAVWDRGTVDAPRTHIQFGKFKP